MRRKAQRLNGSFLCLRRGVSDTRERRGLHLIFSLPTQRCFPREQPGRNARDLFSAYAEVFLSPRARSLFRGLLFSAYAEVFPPPKSLGRSPRTFLCLRRGVSRLRSRLRFYAAFSLPTQRCFFCGLDCIPPGLLFSAYAEVFPTHTDQRHADRSFSLPTQRCFSDSAASCFRRHLFSAYAVVFLG